MKAVIIYFSLEGNTDAAARLIAEKTGADLIRLIPEKQLPAGNFQKYFWGGKSAVFNEKPKLTNGPIDLTGYDTVIIGTPVWAGTFTPPVLTFLTDNPCKDKKVFLFASHSGGGAEKCFTKLKARIDGSSVLGTADFIETARDMEGKNAAKMSAFCDAILK